MLGKLTFRTSLLWGCFRRPANRLKQTLCARPSPRCRRAQTVPWSREIRPAQTLGRRPVRQTWPLWQPPSGLGRTACRPGGAAIEPTQRHRSNRNPTGKILLPVLPGSVGNRTGRTVFRRNMICRSSVGRPRQSLMGRRTERVNL